MEAIMHNEQTMTRIQRAPVEAALIVEAAQNVVQCWQQPVIEPTLADIAEHMATLEEALFRLSTALAAFDVANEEREQ